jgi:signal transduction histidine kinase
VPAFAYPATRLAAPPGANDSWVGWWLVGASFLALGLPALWSRWFRARLPYLYTLGGALVTAHLFVLAHRNDMHSYYATGSALSLLATAMLAQSRPLLTAYLGMAVALGAVLFALEPSPRKLLAWGVPMPALLLYRYRLGRELAAAELRGRYRGELEREVAERTRELSAANERLKQEILQRERLEEELQLSNKMDALGRMAGGLAHDFNNLFTTIGVYTEFLLQGLPADSSLRSEAQQIQRTTRQASALTRQLLTLSRRGRVEAADVDLCEVVAELVPVLERILGEDVELCCRLCEQPASLRANRSQLEQVLLNLVLNSRDALPRGGTLQIDTWICGAGDLPFAEIEGAPAAEYVGLAVTDDGEGMDEPTRGRAFEPFFTTKGGDRGTGLGLSIVYGIVRQSGGQVRLLSAPGKGTRFEFYWPRAADARSGEALPEVAAPLRGHDERVLLVEDQDDLREALRRVLREAGYRVEVAADGAAALDQALEPGAEFDLVVSDVVMPRMSGLDLAEHLAAAKPRTRVLLISGHMAHPSLRDREVPGGVALLAKPFEPHELTAKVRELLGAAH